MQVCATTRGLVVALLACWATSGCGAEAKPAVADGPGRALYDLQNCANCHGPDGGGNALGPALEELGAHWTAERLAGFLEDPAPVLAADERLSALSKKYIAQMAPYANLTEDQRLTLSHWLIEQHP